MSITRNSLTTLFAQGMLLVFSLLSGVIITRALGPAGKGAYTAIFIVLLTFVDILRFNMEASTVFHVGSTKRPVSEFFIIFVLLSAVLSFVAIAVYFSILGVIQTYILEKIDPRYLTTAILFMPFYLLHLYLASLLWGLGEIKKYNIVRIALPVALSIGAVLAAVFNWPLSGFIGANIASTVFALLCELILLKSYIKPPFSLNLSLLKNLLWFGAKGAPGEILTGVVYRIGPYLILYFLGIRAMGFYSIALYAELLWHIPFSISVALLPVLSDYKTKDKSGLTQEICRNSLFLTYLFVILLILLSRPLIITLFGQQFEPAIQPFRILLFGTASASISGPLRSYFNGIGKPQINTFVSSLTCLAALVVYPPLIRSYQVTGAAISATSVYLLTAVIYLAVFLKTAKAGLKDTLLISSSDFKYYRYLLNRIFKLKPKFKNAHGE